MENREFITIFFVPKHYVNYICAMETTIEINSLRIHAFHGVMEQEKRVGNIFEVSASLQSETGIGAYVNDNLEETVNYAQIIEVIKQEMSIPSELLENVAYRIKTAISRQFHRIKHGKIKIAKLQPPIPNVDIQSVAVIISW